MCYLTRPIDNHPIRMPSVKIWSAVYSCFMTSKSARDATEARCRPAEIEHRLLPWIRSARPVQIYPKKMLSGLQFTIMILSWVSIMRVSPHSCSSLLIFWGGTSRRENTANVCSPASGLIHLGILLSTQHPQNMELVTPTQTCLTNRSCRILK